MPKTKYLVGIDLGTTNTVVAYAPLSDSLHPNQRRIFEIEQLVAAGEVAKLPMLPSFRYHPSQGELKSSDLVLPWSGQADAHMDGEMTTDVVIGVWARDLGAKVDGRLVTSAKSWLSHAQVDREAAILPWGVSDDVAKVSPLSASASYLHYVRQAWNYEHPEHKLEDQEVVITVPASFDEDARALTVEAAYQSGLDQIWLLEEPQAVCYDWYARHMDEAASLLSDINLLLVCDVGGGTTDFSLIEVSFDAEQQLKLTRVGVGDHLMLGGDNVDIALAHIAEQQLNTGIQKNKKFSSAQLAQLIQQTRVAKERLLSDENLEQATVTVMGSGSRLFAGAKRCELTREQVHQIVLEGFFPLVELSATPNKKRSAVVEFSLPYAADPAITKHLANFVRKYQGDQYQGDKSGKIPNALLFNGGMFNSAMLSERTRDLFQQWSGTDKPVKVLDNRDPHLAVAYGAVAYAMARRGAHMKIGGGAARSFFLLLDKADGQDQQGLCLLPKGTQEGIDIFLQNHTFALTLGQPVRFNIVSTTTDRAFTAGDQITIDESFSFLPPLVTVLDADAQNDSAQVQLIARLSGMGVLQLECVRLDDEDTRWALTFKTRNNPEADNTESVKLPENFPVAVEKIQNVFGKGKSKGAKPKRAPDAKQQANEVKTLRKSLEKLFKSRENWDACLSRALFDTLFEHRSRRRRSQVHERVWFNLSGYCLRPGYGNVTDPWRIEQLWPLYQEGLSFAKETQSWIDWWTFWRRAAGGLQAVQQSHIFKQVLPFIDHRNLNNRKIQADAKLYSSEDILRLLAVLEHVSVADKTLLGEVIVARLGQNKLVTASHWWALGRVASRAPIYGSAHNVVPPDVVAQWLEATCLKCNWKGAPQIAFAAVMAARLSGDRARDLDETVRQKIIDKLRATQAPDSWVRMLEEVTELDEAESKRVFGEVLPQGLTLVSA
ncbi:MAG: molecular chaperone DnaK [Alteromonadaceae bacterium]|nr:MAG: molecular chaperone DnaK [Alteromonadaceae bacterium]